MEVSSVQTTKDVVYLEYSLRARGIDTYSLLLLIKRQGYDKQDRKLINYELGATD